MRPGGRFYLCVAVLLMVITTTVSAGDRSPDDLDHGRNRERGASPRLEIRERSTENAWIAYGDAPAFGYGLSPQEILTKLTAGPGRDPDLDFRDYAGWAFMNGFTIARSYPPSVVVGPRYLDLFERSMTDTSRFDLRSFNARYFDALREACDHFRRNGIFVHLQLWQAVYWKDDWKDNYYNPKRNVNSDLSDHAGPGKFVIPPSENPALIAHQKEHVRRILDATGDLGNVFYDLMNEIGNGTGLDSTWVEAMLDEFEAWEKRTGLELIVGLNDEGHDRPEAGSSLTNPRLDIAFLDRGRYDEHIEARSRLKKPTFGVRNIDWNPLTETRMYFAGESDLTVTPDLSLFNRSRRMYWRMFLAKCQMNAGYADWGRFAYRVQGGEGLHLPLLQRFGEIFAASYASSRPAPEKIAESPADRSYLLESPHQAIVLLESLPGTAGKLFGSGTLTITDLPWPDGKVICRIAEPRPGLHTTRSAEIAGGSLTLPIPAFRDCMILEIAPIALQSDAFSSPRILPTTDLRPMAETGEDGVRLSWAESPDDSPAEIYRWPSKDTASDLSLILRDRRGLIGRSEGLSYLDRYPRQGTNRYRIVWWSAQKETLLVSQPAVVTIPDLPPAAPVIRPIRVTARRVVLLAAGCLTGDIAGYQWQRRPGGQADWSDLRTTPNFRMVDDRLSPGGRYEYRVHAVDDAGGVGPYSEPITIQLERLTPKRVLHFLWRHAWAHPLYVLGGIVLLAALIFAIRRRRR